VAGSSPGLLNSATRKRKIENFQKLNRESNPELPYCGAMLTAVFPEHSKDCGAFIPKPRSRRRQHDYSKRPEITTANLHTSINYTAEKALKPANHSLLPTFGDIL
jgi:hypothetical protein